MARGTGKGGGKRLPRVARSRRLLQIAMSLLVLTIGVQFTLWVRPHLAGAWPTVSRPPGVEGFLPINSMLGFRNLLNTGLLDAVHPAGLSIFIAICALSWLVARSFCSHLCPIGLLSEWLGRLGLRLSRRRLLLPRWLDVPLRCLKWLLLAFFVWAIWFAMSPPAVALFLQSPYARVADAKLWLFFAEPSRTTLVVLGVLTLASLLIRDFWCRYLCPYGALLGLLGRLSPFRLSRDPESCTDCRACTRVCPARLQVHRLERVSSVECTSCQDCVLACPTPGCLSVRSSDAIPSRLLLTPAAAVAVVALLYLSLILGFRVTGHWRSSVTEAEYHQRLQEIRSSAYSHPGG